MGQDSNNIDKAGVLKRFEWKFFFWGGGRRKGILGQNVECWNVRKLKNVRVWEEIWKIENLRNLGFGGLRI